MAVFFFGNFWTSFFRKKFSDWLLSWDGRLSTDDFLDSPGRFFSSPNLYFPRRLIVIVSPDLLDEMALIIKLNRKDGIANKRNI